MKHDCRSSLLACLLACAGVSSFVRGADAPQTNPADKADKPNKAEPSDLDRLQGKWVLTSGEANGRPFRKEMLDRRFTVVVTGNKWDQSMGDDANPDRWTFAIDPSKSPKQIDFDEAPPEAKDGKDAKKDADHIVGIYTMQADRLWVCTHKPGVQDRPKDFKTGDATKVIRVYDRVK